MHKEPLHIVAEKQCLNVPGETHMAHRAHWSPTNLQHLRMWLVILMKYLARCYTQLLFDLHCLQ